MPDPSSLRVAALGLGLVAALAVALLGAEPRAEEGVAERAPAIEATSVAPPGVALWRVTDADSEMFLLGSVHLLDPRLDWRRPAIDAAVAAAERAYFETPVDIAAQAQAALLVMRLGAQPPGRRLSDQLSEDGAARLAAAASDLGFAPATMERLRPWIAMLQIAALSFRKEGLDPNAGVESVLLPELTAAGAEIRYLETIEEQMRFLADLPEEHQLTALEQTLAQLDQAPEQLKRLVGAWATGDLEGLAAENARTAADAPEMHRVIIIERNRNWRDALLRDLDGAGRTLVVVGAAHLVGKQGLPALLAEHAAARGLTIERR